LPVFGFTDTATGLAANGIGAFTVADSIRRPNPDILVAEPAGFLVKILKKFKLLI
jgi:hypothetical protein